MLTVCQIVLDCVDDTHLESSDENGNRGRFSSLPDDCRTVSGFRIVSNHPSHLSTARNVRAYALAPLSKASLTEWGPHLHTLNRLSSAFRTPLIDMLATTNNKVTPIFVPPYLDERTWAINTLSLSWAWSTRSLKAPQFLKPWRRERRRPEHS